MVREFEISTAQVWITILSIFLGIQWIVIGTPFFQRWKAEANIAGSEAEARSIRTIAEALKGNEEYLQYLKTKECKE